VNEEMKEVQDFLKNLRLPVPFHLHIQSTPSSMHSFYALSHYLKNDRFCLTTVDTIFKEEEFSGYIQAFKNAEKIDGLMAVTDFVDDESPLYVKTDTELRIVGFDSKFKIQDSNLTVLRSYDLTVLQSYGLVSGGIYCLKQTAIRVLENAVSEGISRMRNYQQRLVDEGLNLKAYPFSKIIDVDHVGDIKKAEEFLKHGDNHN